MSSSKSNRLIREKSPYLLQHAYNPVDWYPWSDEAFARAQNEDKPIFLSIGYSTCHWCHVMEHESFEDPATAQILNDHFVSIKVDREERPDIDGIYMSAVTAMTGAGGWPLSVFLTPDQKPFYGGTYFPPEPRWGSPGFQQLLHSVITSWQQQREKVSKAGESIVSVLRERAAAKSKTSAPLDQEVLRAAFTQYQENFDSQHGGFGHAPKFPMGHNVSFLLRYWKRGRENSALAMAIKTLEGMAAGGMYDHLGGGFHRYSTDALWQVPHFEKMLYDQAILCGAYLEGYQATRDPAHAQTARDTFDYVLRDLRGGEGGFFCAEDADSLEPNPPPGSPGHKSEGAFYLWCYSELKAALTEEELTAAVFYFGIKPDGNALNDPHAEFTGKNILWAVKTVEETAGHLKKNKDEAASLLSRTRAKLLTLRAGRPRPHLDDKILTDWNGLMISSLALGGVVLDEPRYLEAARRVADFILREMVDKSGRLYHRYRDGEMAVAGNLDDYAFFIHGLLDLYQSCFQIDYLCQALRLAREMIRLFWDEQDGGFFFSALDAPAMILRPKEVYDGAVPSGNSLAAYDLIRLYHFTADSFWRQKAQQLFEVFGSEISAYPGAYAQMLIAYDFYEGPVKEVVVADNGSADSTALAAKIHAGFVPLKIVLLRPAAQDELSALTSLLPRVASQVPVNKQLTFYVCANGTCQAPETDLQRLPSLLE